MYKPTRKTVVVETTTVGFAFASMFTFIISRLFDSYNMEASAVVSMVLAIVCVVGLLATLSLTPWLLKNEYH